MLIRRVSDLTGIEHEMEIPITEEQLNEYYRSTLCIQDVFPHLTPEQREFIKTGTTSEEWDELFDETLE